MKTKREMCEALIWAFLLTVILQIITTNTVINYNLFIRIITGILYYTIFIIIITDIFFAINEKCLYYVFYVVVEICFLGILILLLNFFTNIETLKYGLQGIFMLSILASAFRLLANRNKPDNWDEIWRE